MKTLYILRHAKSSWNEPSIADFDRPLNERGRNAAPFMGELMALKSLRPDLIISSSAKRAMQTAVLVKESSGSNATIQYDEKIYEASPQTLSAVISQIGEDIESVMIVGHNPGIEGLINHLTGKLEAMPTAALAAVSLDIPAWSRIDANCGRLNFIIRPNDEMKALGKLD
ncbi:MAG: histidine phosphatase family protein [Pyrinomonadaceae bacterium]